MRKLLYIGAASGLLLLTGCGPMTTDPHQGGLFGYDGSHADERVAQRQYALQETREDGYRLDEQREDRLDVRQRKQDQLRRMKADLRGVKSSLRSLERKVAESSRIASSKASEKIQLTQEIRQLQARAERLDSKQETSAADTTELESLKKKQHSLEKEVSALMNL